jgi:hypothetical protein
MAPCLFAGANVGSIFQTTKLSDEILYKNLKNVIS